MREPVRFFDPRPALMQNHDHLQRAFHDVLTSGTYILGAAVDQFERELALYIEVPYVVGVASGSDALELALRAVGIGTGDGVITTPFTFVATAEAIVHTGAVPVFADIHPDDWLLDLDRVDEALSQLSLDHEGHRLLSCGRRLRGVVPVHLFGNVVPAHKLRDLAEQHRLLIIEDVAQALGGTTAEGKAGSFGDVSAASFFPTKTLGALGDGGAVVTRHEAVAQRVRSLRQHGMAQRGFFTEVGRNSRLDALQAAFLSVRLPHLDDEIRARRATVCRYEQQLATCEQVTALDRRPGHAAQTMVVQTRQRDELRRFLHQEGIETAVYYETPLHRFPPYQSMPRLGELHVVDKAAGRALALPLYPGIPESHVERVAATVQSFFRVCRDTP